jgi:uncharacterized protein YggE
MFYLKLFCFLSVTLLIDSSRVLQSTSSVPVCCDKDHTITLTGTGRMSIPTDVIRLGFTIETKDMEAQNSFSMNNVIASKVNYLLLNQNMIPEINITTANFQIYPKYTSVYHETNRTSTEVFEGYVVSNQIDVKLSEKLTAIKLIDDIVRAGVTKINYINFDVDPETMSKTKKLLVAMAVKDAFERAEIIATNAKLQILDTLSISLVDFIYAAPTPRAASFSRSTMMDLSESKAIYTGQQEISVSTNVVFLVKKS